MHTKKSKQKLKIEIQHSLFLDEDTKAQLLSVFDLLDDHDYRALAAMIGHAEKKQDALLEQIVKHDDAFPAKVKFFRSGEIQKYRKDIEKKQRQSEGVENILKEIDE